MINLQPNIFIPSKQLTANGVYDFGCSPTNIMNLKIDGVFAGTNCEIGYVNDNNVFTRYNAIPATTSNLQIASLLLGFWSSLAVRITGATAATSIRVHWYPSLA